MDNANPRPIYVSVLIGTLVLCSLSLYWDTRTLSIRNQELLLKSYGLQDQLNKLSSENQAFLTGQDERSKQAQTFQETVEALKKQNETLAFQLKKIEERVNAVKEEKSYLEEMLINKSKQIELLRSQAPGSGEAPEAATGEVRAQIGEKDEELRKLNDQNRVLQEKMERIFKTTNEKMNEINVAKIALAETVSTAQRKIEDEWNTVNLGAVTTSAMPMRQNEIEEAPVPHTAKSEGHVLAINNEHGFVVVDLGKVDNLADGTLLEVKKEGLTVATLSVLEIRDVMAACNIKDVQDGQRIEINDPVSVLR